MNKIKSIQRSLVYISAAALLGACVTPPGSGGGGQAADEDPCSVGKSALVGAAVGAVLGAIVGGNRGGAIKGAALGTGVGVISCVAFNIKSQQTKTAAQAEQDYLRTKKELPSEPVITAYSSQLQRTSVRRGQPVNVNSTLELVNGRNQKVTEVREELVVFNPDGTPFKTGSKAFSSNSAGRYENTFELKLPQGAPQGEYALKTNVYVNGKMMATRDLRTQVVWNGTTGEVVAAR